MTSHYLFQKLQTVTMEAADEAQANILKKAKQQVGFLPNMYLNMANVPAFLDTYLHGYELFRQQSELNSAEQEVVFLAISQQNDCRYCMAAHSTLAANHSGVPKDVLQAIRSDTAISDARLNAVYTMAVEINNSRGRPQTEIVKSFLEAGFNEKHLMSIILAVSVKIMSN
ncbi:hypothetical protein MNBD_GAMMA06-2024 [hydrothermal vent metagenome]|uniref:Carboxymuconolactone decarboxylase-like domain-containing protein n=1 Tax=hydrothermal vent metagenome TaxID=652676 RepID=A0A3B0X8V9_9ZZZZ